MLAAPSTPSWKLGGSPGQTAPMGWGLAPSATPCGGRRGAGVTTVVGLTVAVAAPVAMGAGEGVVAGVAVPVAAPTGVTRGANGVTWGVEVGEGRGVVSGAGVICAAGAPARTIGRTWSSSAARPAGQARGESPGRA